MCQRVDTKHPCFKYGQSVCNICSTSCSEDELSYNEKIKEYSVGKCKKCVEYDQPSADVSSGSKKSAMSNRVMLYDTWKLLRR